MTSSSTPAFSWPQTATKRGLSKEQIPVLNCRDGNGNTANFVLKDRRDKEIARVLRLIVDMNSVLCTDAAKLWLMQLQSLGVGHSRINFSKNIGVKEAVYHI